MDTTNIVLIMTIFLVFVLILGTVMYRRRCNDNFDSSPNSSKTPLRPDHPSWYEDIPETHPEVLELIRQTEEQVRETPIFTERGFKKMKMPDELYKFLLDHVKKTNRIKEDSANIFRRTSSGPPPYLIPIDAEQKKWVFDTLKPILENWSGLKGLIPTSAYGPREYRRGSSLRMHVDTGNTHIISAILHIDRENMDKDWPLVVINRQGKREEVFMKPGDMVLYESASLPHSREQKLEGDYYTNMFVHFAPPNYVEMKENFISLQNKVP